MLSYPSGMTVSTRALGMLADALGEGLRGHRRLLYSRPGARKVAANLYLAARQTAVMTGGTAQAAPAPRFSRTATEVPGPPRDPEDVEAVLADWNA